jgi:osmotically-inducible protein OsmY
VARMPPQYLAGRIREALAEDPRTNELGIRVVVRADQVFVQGQVAADERRERILEVVQEHCPGMKIHDELTVPECGEPEGEERLQ